MGRMDVSIEDNEGRTEDGGSSGTSLADYRARIQATRVLLDPPSLWLVQQLLASDSGALSIPEIQFRTPDPPEEPVILDHLLTLIDVDLVTTLQPEQKPPSEDMPTQFFAPTPLAITLLKELGHYDQLGLLYQLYDTVEEPPRIQRISSWEHRPEPDWL